MSELEFRIIMIRILACFENSIEPLSVEIKEVKSSQDELKMLYWDAISNGCHSGKDGQNRAVNQQYRRQNYGELWSRKNEGN